MFSTTKFVDISENIYLAGSPIFYISRIVGLAPFKIKIINNSYNISLSMPYLLLSYIFGIIITSAVVYEAICDRNMGPYSVIKSLILTYVNMFLAVFIAVVGIFSTPLKVKYLWNILSTLNEVDLILNYNNGESDRKNNIIFLNFVLFLLIALQTFDLCRIGNSHSVLMYLLFYFFCFIVFILETQYWHIVQSVRRRLKKLNDCFNLTTFIQNSSYYHFKSTGISSSKSRNQISKNITDEFSARQSLEDHISELSFAHSKLFEVVDQINDGYGFLALVIIVSCLFHLVTVPYFLLLDILGEIPSSIPGFILQFFWVSAHVLRTLIIVEPCQAACDEAASTNHLIAKLLNSDLDNQYKRKLHLFSLQLIHRDIEFTAFGLCKINRSLLTSVAGAVTTYLVILLQFR